jgi:hypothetical protein
VKAGSDYRNLILQAGKPLLNKEEKNKKMKTINMKNQKKSFVTYFVVFCALILATFSTAQAATFTVKTEADLKDTKPGDGLCITAYKACTLRAAIEEANALPGDDDIVFGSSFQAPNPPKTILLKHGPLEITSNLSITGTGARQLMIDGNHQQRVLYVSVYPETLNVTINFLTIQNGYAYAPFVSFAAGIVNNENLFLTGVTVRNNYALNEDNPYQGEKGGGIGNSGYLLLNHSTVSGNKAGIGGGIYNEGSMHVRNSTISGNSSFYHGGGIYQEQGHARIVNTTIANNVAPASIGGGIIVWSGDFFLANTIVASNYAEFDNDITGKIISEGNNLIKTRGSSTGYVASDLPHGTDASLGALKNNGGHTDTHALLSGSPAIDAGSNCSFLLPAGCDGEFYYDQRGAGFARKVGRGIDIGAFEFQGEEQQVLVRLAGKVLKPNGSGLNKAIVTLTGTDGAPQQTETDAQGNFNFFEVVSGRSYIVSVEGNRYSYAPQSVFVTEERQNLTFVPVENGAVQ